MDNIEEFEANDREVAEQAMVRFLAFQNLPISKYLSNSKILRHCEAMPHLHDTIAYSGNLLDRVAGSLL